MKQLLLSVFVLSIVATLGAVALAQAGTAVVETVCAPVGGVACKAAPGSGDGASGLSAQVCGPEEACVTGAEECCPATDACCDPSWCSADACGPDQAACDPSVGCPPEACTALMIGSGSSVCCPGADQGVSLTPRAVAGQCCPGVMTLEL
jgi:hypothetical protein